MKASEFVEKAKGLLKLNTSYLMGGFGCRLGKDWYDKTYAWNKDNAELIESRTDTDPITFGFDCVCMLKSLWWGFDGNTSKPYGSAVYASNGVADMSIASLKKTCPELLNDFNNIEEGEIVFLGNNHCGVYIGNGEVIESTPAWKCCVQKTLLPWRNSTNYDKLPVRAWDFHGKTNLLEYPAANSWRDMYAKLSAKYTELDEENRNLKESLKKVKQIVGEINV